MMVLDALNMHKNTKEGTSRASIANCIKGKYKLKGGSVFNAALRKALQSGIESGIFEHGATKQRFKLTNKGREELNIKNKSKSKKSTEKNKKSETRKQKQVILLISTEQNKENPTKIKVKTHVKWSRVFETYCNHNKLNVETLEFYFEDKLIDKKIKIEKTINASKIEHDDEIPTFLINVEEIKDTE